MMQLGNTLIALGIMVAFILAALASPLPKDTNSLSIVKRSSSSGWNDFGCTPSAGHTPIVLVHGMWANAQNNWLFFAPRWAAKDYCVFSLTYGKRFDQDVFGGLDSIENSGQELSNFVDRVLNATGTSRLNIVAHSEGTVVTSYYLKFRGGNSKVDKFAAIGGAFHGSTVLGLVPFLISVGLYDPVKKLIDPLCLSCFQMAHDAEFIKKLNEDGDTAAGVKHLNIITRYEQFVTPPTSGFLTDKNPNVKNVWLQDLCPLSLAEHLGLMASPVVFAAINAYFDSTADQSVNCLSAFT